MRFNDLKQTPYIFVVKVTCPKCSQNFSPIDDHSSSGSEICPSCGLKINLRYVKKAEKFYSINLLRGKCPNCTHELSPTYAEKRNGSFYCKHCDGQFDIWLINNPKYENRTDYLLNEIDNLIESSNLEAAIAMIDSALNNERQIIRRRLGRSTWIFTVTDILNWGVSQTPRWMNLSRIIVPPTINFLSMIFIGKRVDIGIAYLNRLIYKKVLIRANIDHDFDQFDLTNLLDEVYMFLILTETADFEIFYNQLVNYLEQKVDPREIDQLITGINLFFDISISKDEEWLEIFWRSLADIIAKILPNSKLVKSIRAYYRHLGYFGEQYFDQEQDTCRLEKYEEVFGVKTDHISEHDLKKKYRELVRIYHPDKPGGDEAKFRDIQEAYIYFKSIYHST